MLSRITTIAAAAAALGALALSPTAASAQAENLPTATATVHNADGEELGTVIFTATPSGMTHVAIKLEGLPSGAHGFHVHETGVCDAADGFQSAGGHYAGDKEHGVLVEGGPHPGDFPNIHVAPDGVVVVQYFTDQLSVGSEGENPLADEDGSAVMVHAGPDDYESQPAGDAGSRIACGVIE